ncbi:MULTISPECIES: hypothetical protein [unclassified Granulicatella]|uniref:hypothetical protein n=1 Tax=unclassified Granulicatella TaxID=2630493 RepID=UPI0010740C19|nr:MULTISPECIES: hypothetical protein [unclassified Granulicatella]TFU93825.1 hypothetical protein E4T68_06825 [Granulicatella sp. WM01]
MKKIGLIAILMISLVSFDSQQVSAAGCGVSYIYATSTPVCRNEHCGIWDLRALVQEQYRKSLCVRDDNSTYWSYKTDRVHLKCSC